jgi:hypothetical protein
MSLIDTTGVITYDNNAQRIIHSEPFTAADIDSQKMENSAKAILQTVYSDAGRR